MNLSQKLRIAILRARLNELGNELLFKLATSVAISIVISIVSFREFWMNDTFHIVFLTQLLYRPTRRVIRHLIK